MNPRTYIIELTAEEIETLTIALRDREEIVTERHNKALASGDPFMRGASADWIREADRCNALQQKLDEFIEVEGVTFA